MRSPWCCLTLTVADSHKQFSMYMRRLIYLKDLAVQVWAPRLCLVVHRNCGTVTVSKLLQGVCACSIEHACAWLQGSHFQMPIAAERLFCSYKVPYWCNGWLLQGSRQTPWENVVLHVQVAVAELIMSTPSWHGVFRVAGLVHDKCCKLCFKALCINMNKKVSTF